MRPVDKGASNPGYTPPTNLTFTGANGTIMQKIYNTTSPKLTDCLNLWLADVKGSNYPVKNPPVTVFEMDTASSAIQSRVNDIYKRATVPLTSRLGDFCSYCGTPLPGLVEVEHMVPKSQYPTFSCEWSNFLMSCGPCNTKKGDIPDRATVKAWLGGKGPYTEKQYRDKIINNHYVWPDRNAYAYRLLSNAMYYKKSGNWKAITTKQAADPRNVVVSFDIATRTVVGKFYTGPAIFALTITADVKVDIDSTSSNGVDKAKGNEMIALCGLNDIGNLDSTYDRRVVNRTLTWFKVCTAWKFMDTITTQAQFDLVWPLIASQARAAGFYSLWVTILNEHKAPNGTNVGDYFVTSVNKKLYFPNTVATYVP
ncbi:MAG: HNH endonuclease [Bacteroidota bacterium]